MGGGDETLRPEYFAPLGLSRRRLAGGLFAAAFVGVAPAVSAFALLGTVIAGARLGVLNALVALPAAALTLALFVLAAKVMVGLVGLALRSRAGAIGAGLVNGGILASLGQVWVFVVALGPTGPPAAVWWLPSGWGLLAVQGQWLALLPLAAVVLLLLAAWAALLGRRVGTARPATGRRWTSSADSVLVKELKTWSRDLVRTHGLAFALSYGVCFAASPLLIGWNGMLPYAGPIFVAMAAAMTANQYGNDGTALWLTVLTPGGSDVRGRQAAWLVAIAPVATALTVGLTAVAHGPWPLVLALLPALLGAASGLVPLVSVYALVPAIDPHRRAGNPLRTSEDDGGLTGLAYLMLALVVACAAPAGLVAIRFGWVAVPLGAALGVLFWWGFGLLAERRLRSHGPELLEIMRTGRRPRPDGTARFRLAGLSRTRRAIAVWGLSFGAIPLVPQGIVAALFIAHGKVHASWFLATYAPAGWRYPVAAAFIALGLALYGAALWVVMKSRTSSIAAGS